MLESSTPPTNGHGGEHNVETCCPQNQSHIEPQTIETALCTANNNEISESEETTTYSIHDENEPLGYQHFLCDVNIEYSPGGHLSSSDSNQHCFKMKNIPYMVKREICRTNRSSDETGSSQSLSEFSFREEDSLTSDLKTIPIDVTKTTCAFLGNSEYVPNHKFNRRRVVLEMISAKLSQSTIYNAPIKNDRANLLERRQSAKSDASNNVDNASQTPSRSEYFSSENQYPHNTEHNSTPLTSKKFVNYTILIKTAPGLDSHPAVIERRFSDFLLLNRGLKQLPQLAHILDRYVTFPKKVYMGNFSVANIAERSIVFAKLLDICMTYPNILWSDPFISFLLDKELNEAHRLSLCGDPEDVQALIETSYFIEKKIYLNWLTSSKFGESSNSTLGMPEPSNYEPRNCYSPLPTTTRIDVPSSSSDETISAESVKSMSVNNSSSSNTTRSSPLQSVSDGGDDCKDDKVSKHSSALNQRVVVTFCILILTYYRGENHSDLKSAIRDFSQLVSSRSFVESIANTPHILTLRACLLFLMNINQGDVVDDNQRFWLKRRLEDIDGLEMRLSKDVITTASSNRQRGRNIDNGVCRVRMGDLASMLKDRNFCSFK